MTDIVDPGTINNGDTPDWDLVQAYFDAIYTVINNPGQLDNNNIKSAAAIAYSKLNLSNSIDTGDLKANIVTPAKMATPTTGSVTNAGLVSQGTANTYIAVCSYAIPVTGTYTFDGIVRSQNGTGAVGAGQIQTIVTLAKNLTPVGAADVMRSYEDAAVGEMIRTQRVHETLSLVASDVISLFIQASFGTFASIDVSAGNGDLYYERRSQ